MKEGVDEGGSSAACEYYDSTSFEGLVGNNALLTGTERIKQSRWCRGYTVDLCTARLFDLNYGQNCILT
jgi:hypothetical protein